MRRQGHGARPIPPRLLYFPFTYEYKDSAMVPTLLGNAPDLRDPRSSRGACPRTVGASVERVGRGASAARAVRTNTP